MAKKAKESPALHLLRHIWANNCCATSHSWERVNRSMIRALEIAISAGLRFDVHDFSHLPDFRCGYWISDDGGEWAYRLAVAAGNTSACESFEKWKSREPIIADDVRGHQGGAMHGCYFHRDRERLAVGLEFSYGGYRPTVTSFKDGAAIACTYKGTPSDYPRKVAKRFTITREMIIEDRADRKWRRGLIHSEEIMEKGEEFLSLVKAPTKEDFFRVPRKRIESALKKLGLEA